MVYIVVAIEVEGALVEVRSAQHALAVELYVVARFLVHENLQRSVRRAVDEEVELYVRADINKVVLVLVIVHIHRVFHLVSAPLYVVLRRQRSVVCGVVHQDAVAFGCSVDVDGHLAASSAYLARAGGVGCAVEALAVERVRVVRKQVLRLDVYVVRPVREVVVMQSARHDTDIVVSVVDSVVAEAYLVWQEVHRVATQGIRGVECCEAHAAVHLCLSDEVYVLERTHHVQLSVDVCVDIIHEAVAESAQELCSCALSLDAEVDIAVAWRHIAVDYGASVALVLSHGVELYASFLRVVADVGEECAHASALKLEVVYLQVGVDERRLAEHARQISLARRHAVELYGVEVDEVEHVVHVHVLQLHGQRVVHAVRSRAVDADSLVAVTHLESVYIKMVLVVGDACRMDVPRSVADGSARLKNVYVRCRFALLVLGEDGAGVQHATHRAAGVVLELHRGVQMVVERSGTQFQRKRLALLRYFLYAYVCLQRVARRLDVDVCVAIVGAVVRERRHVAPQVDAVLLVVELAAQTERAVYLKRHAEQLLQPFGVVYGSVDGEVVMLCLRLLFESGDGRQLVGNEVEHASCDRVVAEVSVQVYGAEVALEVEEVVAVVESRHDIDVADRVAGVGVLHREVRDVHLSLCVVEVAALDVAHRRNRELCVVPLVGELQRSRHECLHIGVHAQMWRTVVGLEQAFDGGAHVRVVDSHASAEHLINIVGLKVDVAVGVSVVADVVDAAACADVVLRTALSVYRERHDAGLVGAEQLVERKVACLYVSMQRFLLLRSRQLHAARSATHHGVQRQVGVGAVGFGGERDVAEIVHDGRQLVVGSQLVYFADGVARSEQLAHLSSPGGVAVVQSMSVGFEHEAVVGGRDAQVVHVQTAARAVEVDAERKRHVEIAQLWHETGYVARRYARCVQTAFEAQRLHVGLVALHAVRSHDALALHHRLRQLQTKLLYLRPAAAYHGVERKTAQRETTALVQREAFHLHVKRVVSDAVHYEMGADVARLDVVGREALRFGSTRKHTVAHRTVADNERVDLQVDRRLLLRGVLRGERVYHKLEVGLRLRRSLVEIGVEAEELCGCNLYLSVGKCQQVYLHRDARHVEHLLLLLVEHLRVVDDDAVDETEVDTSDAHLRAQLFRQYAAYTLPDSVLYEGNVQKGYNCEIQAGDGPYYYLDSAFEHVRNL